MKDAAPTSAVAILCLALPLAAAASSHAPTIVCPDLPSTPTIDGRPADAAWARAARLRAFHDKVSGEPAPAATEILLGRRGGKLYVAARLAFRPGHKIESFAQADDEGDIYKDDCIEIFFAPDVRRAGYVHLMVNSDGRLWDSRSPSEGEPPRWDLEPRPQTAALVDRGELQIETALDLKALLGGAPRPGDVCGVKFCRTHWDRHTRGARKCDVFTTHVPASGPYNSRPFARLVFGRVTGRTRKILAALDDAGAQAHPIHRLIEAARTRVWAKPYKKLFRNRRYQSERLIFHDTGTGAEVWRVTCNPYDDGVTYANRFPWNADGSWVMFCSRDRLGGYWHIFMAGDGEHVVQIPGAERLANPRWRVGRPNGLLSAAGRDLVAFDIATGKTRVLAHIPDNVPGRAKFGPNGRWAAVCKQGFGEGGVLTVIDTKAGSARRIKLRTVSADFNGDWLYSAGIPYVGDTPHVGYSLNHLPHLSREHPYQQWVMNLETGAYRQVRYLSHGGTSPLRDRKVGYAGGGVYLTDWFGGHKKFVLSIGTGGHIAWMSSPEWCVAGNSGAPGGSRFACQLVQVYVDTGNWCRIAHGQTSNTTYSSCLFCNTSPDGTKVEYSSTMLGPREMYWAVMHWPEPPRLRGARTGRTVQLEWDRPQVGKEYCGARIWRAQQSGGPYRLVSGRAPLVEFSWTDADAPEPAYYVATSVEHSTLESRRLSNEVAPVDGRTEWPGKLRLYVEAEMGQATDPFAANFHGSASCDRYVEHRHGKGEGRLALRLDMPKAGAFHVWARVRAQKEDAVLTAAARRVRVANREWEWARLGLPVSLPRGAATITLNSSSPGLGVDKLLVTDDAAAAPAGFGDTEGPAPARVDALTAEAESPYDVRLEWAEHDDPAVHHFNIYRLRKPGGKPSQETLVASPSSTRHLDWGLEPGTHFEYAVTAVDSFGRESEPARVQVSTPGLVRRVIRVEAESGAAEAGALNVVKDAGASAGAYVQTPPEKLGSKWRLLAPFEVEVAGEYVVWVSMFPLKDAHIYQIVGVDDGPKRLMYMGSQRSGSTKRRLLWRPFGAVSGVTPLVWRLEPGKHRIVVQHVGKPGFARRFHAIDQFVVTNDRSFAPPAPTWEWE